MVDAKLALSIKPEFRWLPLAQILTTEYAMFKGVYRASFLCRPIKLKEE